MLGEVPCELLGCIRWTNAQYVGDSLSDIRCRKDRVGKGLGVNACSEEDAGGCYGCRVKP